METVHPMEEMFHMETGHSMEDMFNMEIVQPMEDMFNMKTGISQPTIMCNSGEDFIEEEKQSNHRMLHPAVTHTMVSRCRTLPVIEDHVLKQGATSSVGSSQ